MPSINIHNNSAALSNSEEERRVCIHNSKPSISQISVTKSSPVLSFSAKKKKPSSKSHGFIIPLFSFLFAFLLLFLYIDLRLGPKMMPLAENEANALITRLANETLAEISAKSASNYESLVDVRRGADGFVLSLATDTVALNEMKVRFLLALENKLEEEKTLTVALPVGSVAHGNLFSGRGFPVKVALHPVGHCAGEIKTEFESCGINQTMHRISLEVRVSVLIILPGQDCATDASLCIPICENIFSGKVPQVYVSK